MRTNGIKFDAEMLDIKQRYIFQVGNGFLTLINCIEEPDYEYQIEVIPLKGQVGDVPHPVGSIVISGSHIVTDPNNITEIRTRGYISPHMISSGLWKFKSGPEGVNRWCIITHGEWLDRKCWHVTESVDIPPSPDACKRYLVLLDGECFVNGEKFTSFCEIEVSYDAQVNLDSTDAIVAEFFLMEE